MMVLKNNLLIFYQRNFIEFLTDLADQMNWLSAKNWYILKMEQFCAVVGKKIHQMICFVLHILKILFALFKTFVFFGYNFSQDFINLNVVNWRRMGFYFLKSLNV